LFQSTRPRGARHHAPDGSGRGRWCFNPRARVGRDQAGRTAPQSRQCFNPRARVGRDASFCSRSSTRACFNPRARVGRDDIQLGKVGNGLFVSIHAPAWGATPIACCFYRPSRCFNPRARVGRDRAVLWGMNKSGEFQSTRPRGARLQGTALSASQRRFNPRARVGRDEASGMGLDLRLAVSIHAPAWGATRAPGLFAPSARFQSTRPRGARPRVYNPLC